MVEAAHPDVLNLILQVLESGKLLDAQVRFGDLLPYRRPRHHTGSALDHINRTGPEVTGWTTIQERLETP